MQVRPKGLRVLEIPEKFQSPFSRLMIWAANNLPYRSGGLLDTVKEITISEQKSTNHLSDYYKLPKEFELDLIGLRLTEIYTEDTLSGLLNILRRKFPAKLKENHGVTGISNNWLTTGYSRIGSVGRVAGTSFYGPVIQIKNLRPEIQRIDITFYKFLPSIAGLAFDIHLTQTARDKYKSLLNSKDRKKSIVLKAYYPSIKFFSFSGPSSVPEFFNISSNWIQSLVADTAKALNIMFGGNFRSMLPDAPLGLSTIEIFRTSSSIYQEKKWLSTNRLALNAFGAEWYSFYKGKNFLLSLGEKNSNGLNENHKLFLYPKTIKRRGKTRPDNYEHELFSLSGFLSDWFPYMASIYLLDQLRTSMDWFKKNVSQSIASGDRLNIEHHIRLLSMLQRNFFLYKQFEKEGDLFLESMPRFSSDSDLKYINVLNLKNKASLYEHFSKTIDWQKQLLLPFYSMLESFYSDYLGLLNTGVAYRLAIFAIILSILSIILSIFLSDSGMSLIRSFIQ